MRRTAADNPNSELTPAGDAPDAAAIDSRLGKKYRHHSIITP